MSLSNALFLTQALLGISLLIQSFEMRVIATQIIDRSPWAWTHLEDDFHHWPLWLKSWAAWLLGSHFTKIVYAQLILSLLLPWFNVWAIPALILGTAFCICLRFRGVFNGGSDYMTITVLLGLTLTEFHFPTHSLAELGLYFIAFHCTISYFIAGIVKLKSQAWRSGLALQAFVLHSNYNVPGKIARWAHSAIAIRWASWLVILWECTFPFAWMAKPLLFVYTGIALGFHIGTFFAFGLNRFVFAWAATYPALYYCTLQASP
jgi:hypothetical protein